MQNPSSIEGKIHLGAVIGTTNYRQNYMKEKIEQWITELRMLSKIAWHEPQAAYSYFIIGCKNQPTYFMQTFRNISNQLKQQDEIVRTEFIPAISGTLTVQTSQENCCRFLLNWEGLAFQSFQK